MPIPSASREFSGLHVGKPIALVLGITGGTEMNRWFTSKKTLLGLVAVIVTLAMSAGTALAQEEKPSQISIQGTGLFTKSSQDQIPSHDATNSGGFRLGYSYQFSRWFAAE